MKNNPCPNIPYNYKASCSANLEVLQNELCLMEQKDGRQETQMWTRRVREGTSSPSGKRKLDDSTALEPTICGKI